MNCITLSNALLIHLLVIVYNSSKFFIRYDVMMVDVFQCWESNIQQVTFNPPRIPPGVQFVPANPNVPEKIVKMFTPLVLKHQIRQFPGFSR